MLSINRDKALPGTRQDGRGDESLVSLSPDSLDALRDALDRKLGRTGAVLPLSEAEQRVLLELMPDEVLRVTLEDDETVLVVGRQRRVRVSTGPDAGPGQNACGGQPGDPVVVLYRAVGDCGRELLADFLATGEMQTREIRLEEDGQTSFFEARAVACQPRGMLVLLRNTTPLRDAEDGLSRATEKSDHLHEMLEAESFIRAEEEKIIKSSFEKLADLKEDTINAVTSIVRKKDPDTARHQDRVSHLACAIGQEMGLDKDTVSMVALAALLHDLGKVFVSSSTLLKPGRLTPAEMEEVRKHADTEFEILKGIEFLSPMAEIIHQHHERLDGSGYPRGLTGSAILLEARILAVADVVEAMMSDRPHRRALSETAALEEIENAKGTLFDTSAVDACLRLFREGRFRFSETRTDECADPHYQ
jgi:HD-GYP domain-containing protein (c-di-GMP phosphodiesterase class II)